MRRTVLIWAAIILVIILGLVGCNFNGESGPLTLEEAVHAGVQATLTKDAWLDGVESARKTAIAAENMAEGSETGEDNPAADPAVATPRPTLEPTPTSTLKPASGHLVFPGNIKSRVDSY
ncbi:MAG: hypothetical protein HQ574_04995, partial [Chloroflexi bacterium]|nr:hypothetical protein [Chloroflexota bacterium]